METDPVIVSRRVPLWAVTVGVAATIWIIDQVTKLIAVATLEGQPSIEVIGSVLKLTFVRNPGAAFSLGSGYTIIFSLLALVVVGVIIYTAPTLGSLGWAIALGGILGGSLGNLTDRLLREPGFLRGHVVDFLQLPNWPIFNVADMAVVGSAILMVILTLRGVPLRVEKP
ncbi:MAG: signal peptidase II [Actinobacteria bacterium]|nr:signal peptidase II [Actinomycetota bacterium]